MKAFATRTSTFDATFFPYCRKESKQINDAFKKKKSQKFRIWLNSKIQKRLTKFIRTKENSFFFWVFDIYGIKLLTCWRLNFSNLNKHKFRDVFSDTTYPMCNCGGDIETTFHYILRYRVYWVQRVELLHGIYKLGSTLQNSLEDQLLTVLLYSSRKFALNVNK